MTVFMNDTDSELCSAILAKSSFNILIMAPKGPSEKYIHFITKRVRVSTTPLSTWKIIYVN